jgi:hypothetical protein
MKKHLTYGVLLATVSSISLSSSSLTVTKDNQSLTEQPRAVTSPAGITSMQTGPSKKPRSFIQLLKKYKGTINALLGLIRLWLLPRLYYLNEKRLLITQWQFDDLALLKAIKDNALQLWNIHRPDRKVIRLEEWKE